MFSVWQIPKQYLLKTAFWLFLLTLSFVWLASLKASTPLVPIYHGNEEKKSVALACNVFWGEEYLPAMLDELDKKQVKITFFIGGSWAKRFPELVQEIARRGHELGNHTYSHPHPNTLNKEQNKEQILKAQQLVYDLTGVETRLYAPPYGEFNDTVLQAAHDLGYSTILWSIDTVDWKRPPADQIQSKVIKKLHPGAIILMHPTDPTRQALPNLLQEMEEKGYTVTTVSQLLQ